MGKKKELREREIKRGRERELKQSEGGVCEGN